MEMTYNSIPIFKLDESLNCLYFRSSLTAQYAFVFKKISNSSNLNYISEFSLSNGKIEVVLAFCTAHDIVFTNDYNSILLNKSMWKLS